MRTWLASMLVFFVCSLAACHDDALAPGPSNGVVDAGTRCADNKDKASCAAQPGCGVVGCEVCGEFNFFGCVEPGGLPLLCPKFDCPPACAERISEKSCGADDKCVSVFNDSSTCQCDSPGCCMVFDHCTAKPIACTTGAYCLHGPVCGPRFVPIYESACGSGCVHADECGID